MFALFGVNSSLVQSAQSFAAMASTTGRSVAASLPFSPANLLPANRTRLFSVPYCWLISISSSHDSMSAMSTFVRLRCLYSCPVSPVQTVMKSALPLKLKTTGSPVR